MLMVSMSKLLSQLLGAGEPMFSISLGQLERASGNLGVDVRLTADVVACKNQALKALGLDVNDTNGAELYHALQHLVKKHDGFIASRLGADDPADVAKVLELAVRAGRNARVPHDAWVIKRSVLKRLIKAQPPKAVMKHLGYRTVDSLLKREQPEVLVAAIRMLETDKFQQAFVKQYTALVPQDFEVRAIEIVHPTSDKWQLIAKEFVADKRHNIAHAKEAGVIIVLPLAIDRLSGVTLAVLPRILHYLNEIRLYSVFFKLRQMQPGFGALLAETIQDDPDGHARVAGQAIHWRMIHRHFGEQTVLPELFEPHVTPEDMRWHSVTWPLIALEPALSFWEPLEYVGTAINGQVVSMHIMDVAESALNDLPYDQRTNRHMRRTLWCELFSRYIATPAVEVHVVSQLQPPSVDPALMVLSQKGA